MKFSPANFFRSSGDHVSSSFVRVFVRRSNSWGYFELSPRLWIGTLQRRKKIYSMIERERSCDSIISRYYFYVRILFRLSNKIHFFNQGGRNQDPSPPYTPSQLKQIYCFHHSRIGFMESSGQSNMVHTRYLSYVIYMTCRQVKHKYTSPGGIISTYEEKMFTHWLNVSS